MKKALIVAIALLAAVISAAVGKRVVQSYFDRRDEANKTSKVEDALAAAERQINAIVPKMVDDTTRLDRAKAGPGKKFTYTYTLISVKASDIDSGAWKQKFVPAIRKDVREAEGMRSLFRLGTTVHYRYHGSDGVLIDEIVISPAEVLAK